jgi:FkbH-like protein
MIVHARGINDQVKMVIWDLDDSFWRGTLSEGGMEPITENIGLVKTLAERGIVSSVCSKNDVAAASDELRRLEVWDYFVFPSIQLAPKGPAVKHLLERAGLRPENVLFVDDNIANLEDAAFHCPGLMCVRNADALMSSLDTEHLKGHPDPTLERLRQYKVLESRTVASQALSGSNLDFLRQSEIEVEIRYDVENFLDRIVDLINRSNQLNFTKNRIQTPEERAAFEEKLKTFGIKAGVVKVRDRYGDYGVVGFFMTYASAKRFRCHHFVFSCRVLNMGVEQFVYEFIKRPAFDVKQPVANGLTPFESVDWIKFASVEPPLRTLREQKVVVVGGCDMVQLASYCSDLTAEFTNRAINGLEMRFDDPNFFLSSIDAVEASRLRREIPAWNADDMREFEIQIADADIIAVSFGAFTSDTYFQGKDRLTLRLHRRTVNDILKSERGFWFVRNFTHVPLNVEEKLELVRQSVVSIVRRARAKARVVIISENLHKVERSNGLHALRTRYNEFLKSMVKSIPTVEYVELNDIVKGEWVIDGWHMSRQAYLALAREIMKAPEPH